MPTPRPADASIRPPTLLALPSYLAGSVAALGNRRLVALLKREGLALQQYAVLVALADFGVLAPHELATRLHTDRSHVSTYVESLTKAGLVVRIPDERDRRRVGVDLTEQGREIAHRLSAAAGESQRGVLAALSESEQAVLRALLLRVIAADEPGGATAAHDGEEADVRVHRE